MIYGQTDEQKEAAFKAEIARRAEWRRVFVILPVQLSDGRKAAFQFVEKLEVYSDFRAEHGGYPFYTYYREVKP